MSSLGLSSSLLASLKGTLFFKGAPLLILGGKGDGETVLGETHKLALHFNQTSLQVKDALGPESLQFKSAVEIRASLVAKRSFQREGLQVFRMYYYRAEELEEKPKPHLSSSTLADIFKREELVGGLEAQRRIDERISLFNDLMVHLSVTEINEDIQKLLADSQLICQSLHEPSILLVMKDLLVESWDDFYQLIEEYVLTNAYDIVFYKVRDFKWEDDLILGEIITRAVNSSISGFKSRHVDLALAIATLKKIDLLQTPLEKLHCLVSVVDILQKGSGSADELLPLLISVTLNSQILSLSSNLYYLSNFTFEKQLANGREGYVLSSFEAVMSFLLSNTLQLEENSNFVTKFKALLISGSVEELDSFLSSNPRPSLMENGRLDFTDALGNDALVLCLHNPAMITYLIENHFFNIDNVNFAGESYPFLCAKANHIFGLKIFIEKKCGNLLKPTKLNEEETPFTIATINGHLEAAKILYQSGSYELDTILHSKPATLKKLTAESSLIFLLELGLNPNERIENISLLMYYSIEKESLALTLLEKCSELLDFRLQNEFGQTFLHIAAARKPTFLLESFIKYCPADKIAALMDIQDFFGNTPLHIASSQNSNLVAVILLLKNRANTFLCNDLDLHAHECTQNARIVDLILSARMEKMQSDSPEEFIISVNPCFHITDSLLFQVRSGRPKAQHGKIVYRDLSQFAALRAHLLKEEPWLFLHDISDAVANQSVLLEASQNSRGSHVITKLAQELESFLKAKPASKDAFLLDFIENQDYNIDEAIKNSLSIQELNTTDTDDFQYSHVTDLDRELKIWTFTLKEIELLMEAQRNVGAVMRKFDKNSQEFAVELVSTGYCLSDFFYSHRIGKDFRVIYESLLDNSLISSKEVSGILLSQDNYLQGACRSLNLLIVMSTEFLALQHHASVLGEQLASFSMNLNKSHIESIDKTFKSYSTLSAQVESKAVVLNKFLDHLDEELNSLRKAQTSKMNKLLKAHVNSNISTCKKIVHNLDDIMSMLNILY